MPKPMVIGACAHAAPPSKPTNVHARISMIRILGSSGLLLVTDPPRAARPAPRPAPAQRGPPRAQRRTRPTAIGPTRLGHTRPAAATLPTDRTRGSTHQLDCIKL